MSFDNLKYCVGKEKRSLLENGKLQEVEILVYKHYAGFFGIKLYSIGKSYAIYFPETKEGFSGFIPKQYRALCKEVG